MLENVHESLAEHEDHVELKSFELTSMRVRLAESNAEEIQTLKKDVESIKLGMSSMESRLDQLLHWIGRDVRKPSGLESHSFSGLRSSSYRPLPATDAVEESDIETNSDRAISARKVVPE
jgi:tetrahydromethanopterin S-methyltransferase subunit F